MLTDDEIEGSARVAEALHTPIAGYETELGLYGFRELIRRGAVDIVQVDVDRTRRLCRVDEHEHAMPPAHFDDLFER